MFAATVEKSEGGATIHLSGRFDYQATKKFMEAAQSPEVEQSKELRIDFRQADGVDSSAIGCLLMLHSASVASGRKVILVNCFGRNESAIKIAKLDKMFTIL